ncbi:MAG: type II toxin-antitoxin system RelE family toxin [Candidatus Anammoxibacter sp.]
MEATIKRNFIKDMRKLPKDITDPIEKFIFEQSVTANTIHDLGKLTKISGYSGYYRIRFKIEGKKIVFYRALHRREIYRYFP